MTEIERITHSKHIHCLKFVFELISDDVKIFANDLYYPYFVINNYALKKM